MANLTTLMHQFFRIFDEASNVLPVSVASLPLPSDGATETTLASLLSELQAKADLTETQPVSAVSLPLPSDAATQTTLAALLTELQAKADLIETQPVSLASLPSLAAGINAIGKLAANSGIDIGDVDVLSLPALPAGANNIGDVDVLTLPASVQGPGNPTVDSYTSAVVNLAASTIDQVLVAAPGADKQIWVYGLFMMADTAAGTVVLQDDTDAALSGTMAVSDEGGWVLPLSGNFAMPWLKLGTNKALEADTGACTVDGIIAYAIVSV